MAAGDAAAAAVEKGRIRVSSTKKTVPYYVKLAEDEEFCCMRSFEKCIKEHGEVELSGVGDSLSTVALVVEILKNNEVATEKKILTSTTRIRDTMTDRFIRVGQLRVFLEKPKEFDDPSMAKATTGGSQGDGKEESCRCREPKFSSQTTSYCSCGKKTAI